MNLTKKLRAIIMILGFAVALCNINEGNWSLVLVGFIAILITNVGMIYNHIITIIEERGEN